VALIPPLKLVGLRPERASIRQICATTPSYSVTHLRSFHMNTPFVTAATDLDISEHIV